MAMGSCTQTTRALCLSAHLGILRGVKHLRGLAASLRLEVTQAAGQEYLGKPGGGLAGSQEEEL